MNEPSLEARVARLERLVEDMHRLLEAGAAPAGVAEPNRPLAEPARRSSTAAPGPEVMPAASGPVSGRTAWWRAQLWDSELWLNKLGIGLVLFGVTFLFKYSIDQGWLTPTVRVAFGAAVGLAMLMAGLRLGDRQRSLGQFLLGGGVATFYIVGFAAFQLYELVGYNAAFASMVGVTLLAFVLAVRENQAVLSLVGVKGALGTPFLLYTGAGNFHWLVSYTCVVIAAAVALFLFRGWRSVLWTALVGGWSVLLVAYGTNLAGLPAGVTAERWVLQGAVLFCWAAFGVLAVFWEMRWGMLAAGERGIAPAAEERGLAGASALRAHLYLLVITTPLAVAGFVKLIWPLETAAWGWLTIAIAAAYAGVGGALWKRDRAFAAPHLLAATLVLPVGTVGAFAGDRLYLALAVQAAAFHLLTRRSGIRGTAAVAHLIFAGCAIWFMVRMDLTGVAGSWRATTDVLVIALAFFGSAQLAGLRDARIYRFAVHAAVLAWFWRELSLWPSGAAYVSAAWGVYSLALLVYGLRLRLDLLQKTAVATLLLVVAKLFIVDLAALEALWRIVLFLGLGGLFLLISYMLQGLWEERARIAGQ
jgi:uncharacterized membrane protein